MIFLLTYKHKIRFSSRPGDGVYYLLNHLTFSFIPFHIAHMLCFSLLSDIVQFMIIRVIFQNRIQLRDSVRMEVFENLVKLYYKLLFIQFYHDFIHGLFLLIYLQLLYRSIIINSLYYWYCYPRNKSLLGNFVLFTFRANPVIMRERSFISFLVNIN